MTRDDALALLREYTSGDSLLKHAYAVEAAMRSYARRFGEDEGYWGNVGLLHDFDWEIHPQLPEHPLKGAELLRERGVDEAMIQDMLAHAPFAGVPRDTPIRKAIFAVDELTGFIIAVALVRPSKSLADLEPSSVRKKMKDKGFAAAVNREDLRLGAEELGIELDAHIRNVIEAMRPIATELGLEG
jgi:putative nucleotidyltransferase with HDIG domain